jgi:uncharacterized membrane-anchored protein
MQQMVEGLSLVAISYYALQLTDKAISALSYWLPKVDTTFWHSISVPLVVMLVAAVLLWINRQLHRDKQP